MGLNPVVSCFDEGPDPVREGGLVGVLQRTSNRDEHYNSVNER